MWIINVAIHPARWSFAHFDQSVPSKKSGRRAIHSKNIYHVWKNIAVEQKSILNSGNIAIVSLSTDSDFSSMSPDNRNFIFFSSIMKEIEWGSLPSRWFVVAPPPGIDNASSTKSPVTPWCDWDNLYARHTFHHSEWRQVKSWLCSCTMTATEM